MTVIASHSWATTPKSCVTNSMADAELLGQRLQQLEDLQLRRDVERRGRLVGDDERGAAGERAGDHQALALAAGELVRIALEHGLGLGDLHAAQQPRRGVRGARARCAASGGACQRSTASSWEPILNTGFSAR